MNFKEKKGLTAWIHSHSKNGKDRVVLQKIWEATGSYKNSYQPDAEQAFHKFSNRLSTGSVPTARVVSLGRWKNLLRIAASAAILVIAGFAIFNFVANNEIAFEEISTEYDSIKDFNLEDGTLVSLNSSSSLRFPTQFSSENRTVKFQGEAFFQVAEDASRPFKIESQTIDVQVLGTSFNVRDAENDEIVEVFVKTGKVAVTVRTKNERYTLTPGQVLTFNKSTGDIDLKKESAENPLAWKTRVLKFKEAPLKEIFSQIERLFDVSISAENDDLLNCTFTTTVRATDLKGALQALETSSGTLKITGTDQAMYTVGGHCPD